MAVSWSWAWGLETAVDLQDYMGFAFASTLAANSAPDSTTVYTYPASLTRYSMAQDEGWAANWFQLPTEAFVPAGWLAAPFFSDAASLATNASMMEVKGASTARTIYVRHTTAGGGQLYVDNTWKENFVGLTSMNWHYLALKYDMSGATWSGQVYLNGVAVTALQTDASSAEIGGIYGFYGFTGGTRATYWGGIAIYNSTGDSGEVPRFVTRISPNADTGETGTWAPSVGATNIGVTANDPFDNTTFTQETSPSSADNVITQVDNFATQLGVVPPAIDGITGHTWSSGTSITVNASVGANVSFTTGANVVPDSADSTYGFGTAPIDPDTSAAWASGTTVLFKYTVV